MTCYDPSSVVRKTRVGVERYRGEGELFGCYRCADGCFVESEEPTFRLVQDGMFVLKVVKVR